jgi:hypothetical protein
MKEKRKRERKEGTKKEHLLKDEIETDVFKQEYITVVVVRDYVTYEFEGIEHSPCACLCVLFTHTLIPFNRSSPVVLRVSTRRNVENDHCLVLAVVGRKARIFRNLLVTAIAT